MKIIFLFSLFLLRSLSTTAQVIDSAYLKCTYSLTYVPDSTKPEHSLKDKMCLLIGQKASTFYSSIKFSQDSMFHESVKNGTVQEYLRDPKQRSRFGNSGIYSRNQLFINLPANRITTIDQLPSAKYIYDEDMEQIQWTIAPDTLTINGFPCQKASAFFRGRFYAAWFSNKISIASGPYKFTGLPGLIIRIADSKNNYVYECISVELLKEKRPITIPQSGYVRTTRSEFRKAFKATFENPWESLTIGGDVTIGGQDAEKLKAALQKGMPYNPIELN